MPVHRYTDAAHRHMNTCIYCKGYTLYSLTTALQRLIAATEYATQYVELEQGVE